MDGGGRVVEPLTGRKPGGSPRPRAAARAAPKRRRSSAHRREGRFASFGPLVRAQRQFDKLLRLAEHWPRWGGAAATADAAEAFEELSVAAGE